MWGGGLRVEQEEEVEQRSVLHQSDYRPHDHCQRAGTNTPPLEVHAGALATPVGLQLLERAPSQPTDEEDHGEEHQVEVNQVKVLWRQRWDRGLMN